MYLSFSPYIVRELKDVQLTGFCHSIFIVFYRYYNYILHDRETWGYNKEAK